ncbi:hypothetical protein JOM56_009748 [Amanita muscaria]
MLTEVGNRIFTLPICLRKANGVGYPPGDESVVQYFNFNCSTIIEDKHVNYRAHAALACFLAAAYETMLKWLKTIKAEEKCADTEALRKHWHQRMEPGNSTAPEERKKFFNEVVERAHALESDPRITASPNPNAGPPEERIKLKAEAIAEPVEDLYRNFTKTPTEDLMDFLSKLPGAGDYPLCVTYFDEALELGDTYWALLRLLNNQDPATKMWYVFMGTKARASFFSPPPGESQSSLPSTVHSFRLVTEIAQLLPPYITLGFDQYHVHKEEKEITARMGDFQTIEHLAQYGRPLWSASVKAYRHGSTRVLKDASMKLTNTDPFSSMNKDHVFAVLSQRLCLDTVVAGSEAVELADRSVSHHMRLLIGLTANRSILYTHSPSEPILVLASANLMCNQKDKKRLAKVLTTLTKDLCSAGLVEKGLLGELFARTLLLIARDFTAPLGKNGVPNLLQPVRLLDYLCTLFGQNWKFDAHQQKFDKVFSNAYVNFTHWIVTRDRLPEEPDQQLLANLWARGVALQCCFNQGSIDWLIVIYIFPDGTEKFDTTAEFDPSCLSAVFGQVKNKETGDPKAEGTIRPFCTPRAQSLPYLAVLMELGTESKYSGGSKMKMKSAERRSETGRKRFRTFYDQSRYSISVRGTSKDMYGILSKADIEEEFANLFKITSSPLSNQDMAQDMCPLQRLRGGYITWMDKYVVSAKTPETQ